MKKLLPEGDELKALAQKVAVSTMLESNKIARNLGYANGDSLKRALRAIGAWKLHPRIMVPSSQREILDKQPKVRTSSCLCLFDPHFNYQHGTFIKRCFDLAYHWQVPTLVWAGDYFDMSTFGRFASWPDEQFEEEVVGFEATADVASRIFEKQIALKGNHEERLDRMLSRYVSPERAARILDITTKLDVSQYSYCLYKDWIIGHPDTYSKIPSRTPAWIAVREHKNVAMGHNHFLGMSKCEDGEHWGIDAGCCCDVKRMRYKALKISSRPNWVLGALILMNGHPILLHEDLDWKAVRRQYGSSN